MEDFYLYENKVDIIRENKKLPFTLMAKQVRYIFDTK